MGATECARGRLEEGRIVEELKEHMVKTERAQYHDAGAVKKSSLAFLSK